MAPHQEHSIWNNYSWEPKAVENENEVPLHVGGINTSSLVFEDELDNEFFEDDDFDEIDGVISDLDSEE